MSCSKSILELGLLVLNPLVTYKSNVLAEGFGSLPLENNIFKSSHWKTHRIPVKWERH